MHLVYGNIAIIKHHSNINDLEINANVLNNSQENELLISLPPTHILPASKREKNQ